jgi:DNA helicase II / ATP-dependent DNA helicase PcrA
LTIVDSARITSPMRDQIVREEEAILERVQTRLRAARGPERRDRGLFALREEALDTHADDLPVVLHELAVQHRLQGAPVAELPDVAAPYFAHFAIDARDYLLGQRGYVDGDVRILDWRSAPLARVFYDYREGDEVEEEINGRTIAGVLTKRRIVVLHQGALEQVLSGDEMWVRSGDDFVRSPRRALIGGRAAPAVTALLDADQRAAIEAPPNVPLLVIGSAGSGKTTVALHRLARIDAPRSRVVVPGEGLARLSRTILRGLDSDARVETIDAQMLALAREVFGKLPPIHRDAPGVTIRLKRHPALYRALARYRAEKPFKALRRKLAELFTDRAFLARVIEGTDVSRSAIDETVRHTRLQLAPTTLSQLRAITDRSMLQTIDGAGVAAGTPDEIAGTIDVEDLPILLYFHGARGNELDHLVVDEAEDVSRFELDVLGQRLRTPKSVTVAGDELQRTAGGFDSWEGALSALGVRDANRCELSVSYRCPRPVCELASKILRLTTPIESARDGAPVERVAFPEQAPADLFVRDVVRDLEPGATIAVLTRAPGSFAPIDGVEVMDVDSAKGLEFDYVILPDVSATTYPDDEESRRRLHVGVTRAAHQLWIVEVGSKSPIL